MGWLIVCVGINHWFQARRTTALGIAGTGFAVTGTLLLPLLVWVQGEYGWRVGAACTGVAVLLIGIPIVLLVRDYPEAYGLKPYGAEATAADTAAPPPPLARDFTLGEAVRTRAFWSIAIGTALYNLCQSGIIVHQFPYVEHLIDRETAALILAEINIFSMVGRFTGGFLGDRFPKRQVLYVSLGVCAVGIAVLALANGIVPLLIYGALYGYTWGVRSSVSYSLQGDYFGRRSFGRIAGAVQTISAPVSIVTPILIGVAVDHTGAYEPSLYVMAVLTFISALIFFRIRPPPQPAG
jgi:sugar phosphate permease